MSILAATVLIVALGGSPVDYRELDQAQVVLESYLSRIQTLELFYTETWMPVDPSRYEREHGDVPKDTSSKCELLYAYPSLRLRILETSPNATIPMRSITYFHKGKKAIVDLDRKEFYSESSSRGIPLPKLPVDALGLRVVRTMNTPLSAFLSFPEITTYEGDEELKGERVITLKIGPAIPKSARPDAWSDETYLRVWLAPARFYLPMRMEIHDERKQDGHIRWRLSLESFKPVQDHTRKQEIIFPHRFEFEDPHTVHTWIVNSVALNPRTSDRDFTATPASGYVVVEDGEMKVLSGGKQERDRRMEQSVEEAIRLLGSLEPPRRSPGNSWKTVAGIGIPIVVLVGFVFFFLVSRRKSK